VSAFLGRLVRDCLAASAERDAPERVAAVLRDAIARPEVTELSRDEEEVCLHRSQGLTLMSIRQTPNVLFPPHDHGMVAVIATYDGREIAKYFRLSSHGVAEVGETAIEAGDVRIFPPHAIHAVANVGERHSRAIHAYLGDLVTQARSIWDPVSGEREPYSDEAYFRLARPYDPAKPFQRPTTSFAHSV